jgi:hypothetical protein
MVISTTVARPQHAEQRKSLFEVRLDGSNAQRLTTPRSQPYLSSNVGEANTTDILDHVNQRFRWGATMNQLGNVLARDRRFVKVGFDEGTDIGGFRMRVCVWSIASA